MAGCFVVLEGIDGSGKSTLTEAVVTLARQELHVPGTPFPFSSVVQLREPTYDSPAGRELRGMLTRAVQASPEEWLELFLADREYNVTKNITPALAAGALVVQDRYYFSTAAYQGHRTGPLGPADVLRRNIERGFPKPDLIVYLELDVSVALRRIQSTRGSSESFETAQELVRIAENYDALLPAEALRLDAARPAPELARAVLAEVSGLLGLSGARSV